MVLLNPVATRRRPFLAPLARMIRESKSDDRRIRGGRTATSINSSSDGLVTGIRLRAAIYLRVSTEEQAKEGYSIPAQKERLTQYCHMQGWDIYDYYMDEGVSAKNLDRPELQRLLRDVRDGRLDVVLVFRLDRLTRSLIDLFQLLQTFEDYKVGFKSATEVFDTTTAIGRLFIAIIAALAQWERENLAERVKVAMEEKVRQGLFHGGAPPFGYNLDEGRLYINEEQAHIVRFIFNNYSKGDTLEGIKYKLTKMGVKSPTGIGWNTTTINLMLKNPIYIGRMRWNMDDPDNYFEVETDFPWVVSEELFEEVQRVAQSRKKYGPRSVKSEFVFTGKLFCPLCGRVLVGQSNKKDGRPYNYYRCKGREEKGEFKCHFTSIRDTAVEHKFLEVLRHLKDNAAALEAAATIVEPSDSEHTHEMNQLQKEIEKIKNNRVKWQRAYAEDVITMDDLRERTQEDREREKWLQQRLVELTGFQEVPTEKMTPDQLLEILGDVEASWSVASIEEKKTMVQILVDRIVVQRGKNSQEVDLEVAFN